MNDKTIGIIALIIIALIILGVFLILMTFKGDIEYYKHKDTERKVKDMNCSDLKLYLEYYHIIDVVRHKNPLLFCDDYRIEEDKKACFYMEKNMFEIRPYNVIRFTYDEKCN